MATYLIKVTLIWSLFLLLYELLYRKNPAFTLNRIYLLLALGTGVVLPLISWTLPGAAGNIPAIQAAGARLQNLDRIAAPAGQGALPESHSMDFTVLLKGLYLSGALLTLIFSLRELILIMRTAVYGQYKTVANHRIFSSQKPHAPFSFMGWVFISDPTRYDEKGLTYILKHEAAHNRRKHWLDMILVQMVFVLFWFHPLIWRFRYLLKLVHEFEADHIAAGDNAYEYGHFLLQETLLKGTPGLAHSFYFSPIKYRITMLTSNPGKRNWKYLAALPMLFCCSLISAKTISSLERVKEGNRTSFKGNQFTWLERAPRKVVMRNGLNSDDVYVGEVLQMPVISKINDDSVHQNDMVTLPAQFRQNNLSFYDYINAEFRKRVPNPPDSLDQIQINNIVINKEGKIIYYDLAYMGKNLGGSSFPPMDAVVIDIVENSPDWLPATNLGLPVNVFVPTSGAIVLKPMSFQVRELSQKELKEAKSKFGKNKDK